MVEAGGDAGVEHGVEAGKAAAVEHGVEAGKAAAVEHGVEAGKAAWVEDGVEAGAKPEEDAGREPGGEPDGEPEDERPGAPRDDPDKQPLEPVPAFANPRSRTGQMNRSAPAPPLAAETPLVRAERLTKVFDVSAPWLNRVLEGRPRQRLHAVDDVSFDIRPGETLALVGESGCGKSTVARMLVGLYKPTSGRVLYRGKNLADRQAARHGSASRVQMIFQDPYASLNPRWKISDIVAEPMRVRKIIRANRDQQQRVSELLQLVGLAPADASKYPHQFSGGQRQRISIARALASEPEFLVCDEPTSALDVSVQAQVLNLMRDLQLRHGLTYLFISHNLAVVHHVSDRVGVMYLGSIVELSTRDRIFGRPRHPYTRMLLDAIPDLSMSGRARTPVAGEVPNPLTPPSGCAFHPRCPYVDTRCRSERPLLKRDAQGEVACHAVEEKRVQWA